MCPQGREGLCVDTEQGLEVSDIFFAMIRTDRKS